MALKTPLVSKVKVDLKFFDGFQLVLHQVNNQFDSRS